MHVPKIILLRWVFMMPGKYLYLITLKLVIYVLGYSILNDSHALAYQILLCFYEGYLTPNEL